MIKLAMALGLCALLAACGAEGDPLRPKARVGLGVGTNGASSSIGLGIENSNLSLGLSL
mgnify:CR=1 FL=1